MDQSKNTKEKISSSATSIDFYVQILIIIGVIFLIGFMAINNYSNDLKKSLSTISGYWIGNPEFLASNDLSDFQLFISPISKGVYHGYIIIARGDNIIYNGPVIIKLNIRKKNYHAMTGYIIIESDGDYEFEIPTKSEINWMITGDRLVINSKDKVIFDGYKDIHTSLITKKEWNDTSEESYVTSDQTDQALEYFNTISNAVSILINSNI